VSVKEVLSKVKKHIPKYNKGYNVYQEVKNKTNSAIERNKKLFNKEQQSINWQRYLNETGNPSTNVYQIIEKIQKMQEEN